jgi:hypothetical protein
MKYNPHGPTVKCPELQSELWRIKSSVLTSAHHISNTLSKSKRYRKWGNISFLERIALLQLQKMNLVYGIADKNLGPVLSSKNLCDNQIKLHLFDDLGTYQEILHTSKIQIIENGIDRLRQMKMSCTSQFHFLLDRFILFANWCRYMDKVRLCRIFILWKLHKKAKDNGMESRLIAPNIFYFTADASTFLHYQLAPAVFSHNFVLQDSLELCRLIDSINEEKLPWWECKVATADVVALYPSIDIPSGMKALQWFLEVHSNFSAELQQFILKLAEFVLDYNYVETDGIGSGIFKQVVGVAMGTSFSVVFAIIFMIWLETPIIEKYNQWLILFKRAIDDQIFFWRGPSRVFNEMKENFNNAHPNIKFDWGDLCKSAIYLDLNLDFSKVLDSVYGDTLFIKTSVYCKPSNAFCYLQPESYHPLHNFRGWIRGLLVRNITRTNTIEKWRDENIKLFFRLRARGHQHCFLLKLFDNIRWTDRAHFMQPKVKASNPSNRVVFSTQYVPGFSAIRKIEALDFSSFRNTAFTRNIFPLEGMWVAKAAPKLGQVLRKM